ncbi:MAG TPA: hypothetical protein VJG30_03645 [Candidatus Nanoarchaeia archaeon]|nr:hypothetical protein [Candidatus Nanoarchaeia archaeon]
MTANYTAQFRITGGYIPGTDATSTAHRKQPLSSISETYAFSEAVDLAHHTLYQEVVPTNGGEVAIEVLVQDSEGRTLNLRDIAHSIDRNFPLLPILGPTAKHKSTFTKRGSLILRDTITRRVLDEEI